MTEYEPQVPPAGEEVHLPGPTIKPLLASIGVTLIVIGTTITWFLTIIGAILTIVVVVRWIGDTRRDVDELPEEHAH